MKYKEKFRLAFDVHFLHADVCKDSSTCNRLSAFTRFHFHYPNDLAFAIPDYDVRSIERISSSCLLGEVVSSCLNLETFLFELVRDSPYSVIMVRQSPHHYYKISMPSKEHFHSSSEIKVRFRRQTTIN